MQILWRKTIHFAFCNLQYFFSRFFRRLNGSSVGNFDTLSIIRQKDGFVKSASCKPRKKSGVGAVREPPLPVRRNDSPR